MIEGKEIKVAVASPVMDYCCTFWAYDLTRMMMYSQEKGIKTGLLLASASLIPRQRIDIAKAELSHPDFTHMLWLDSDMRFPIDTMERLLAHKLPAVCASYTERSMPFRPVAFPDIHDVRTRAFTTPESTGLQPIDACGLGIALIETDVIRKMSKPWFMVGYDAGADAVVGEDFYFFLKMKHETGTQLYMDHDLTKEVAHIGRMEWDYTHALRAQAQREAIAAKQEEEKTSGVI
jgi:hypothetical protein